MSDVSGAPFGTGSRPTDQAPAGLGASRVDPSRGAHWLPTMIDAAMHVIATLHPTITVQIGYLSAEACKSDDGEEVAGLTLYPDDGSAPEIWISEATPVYGVPDTLLHEMAHVVAGLEADHGPVWEREYEALWAEMNRICDVGAQPNTYRGEE